MPTATIQPWGTVYGTGLFTVNGREYVLQAADGAVYACLESNFPVSVPLPSGVTITGTVRFTQAGTTVFMWRGADLEPLQCTDLGIGFETVPDPPTGLGLKRIPNGLRAILVGDRMWVQTAEGVEASDVLEFTRYRLSHSYAINSAPGDVLKTIVVFGSGITATIVALKRRSIHRFVNVAGDLTDLILVTVTNRFGIVAEESVVDAGADLFWLTDEGVASLTLTDQGEVQPSVRTGREAQPMLSDPIQPLIERIHWPSAANAWGAFWNGNYYLAVPLDSAESFREELAYLQFSTDDGAGTATIPDLLVTGATYRWIRGAAPNSITCGSTTLTADGDFTATDTSATFTGDLETVVLDSLRRIFKGVNTAVLVYSTRNGAWAGYDTAEGLEVKAFFTAKAQSRLRLFFVSNDGWVNMTEEAFEDWLPVPYVEVFVNALPAPGDTIQVNGGTLVTATADPSNTATTWGCQNFNAARQNLYVTSNVTPTGYNPQGTEAWTAPNTKPFAVDPQGSVRFYATNGLLPTIVITGTWATVTPKTKRAIPLALTTRAHRAAKGVMQGRPLELAVQLQTWDPEYSLSLLPEGVEEEVPIVTDQTRSRVQYDRPWDKADWDQTNVNDDFLSPYRGDYSLVFTSEDMSLTLGANGVKLDQHQEVTHTVRSSRCGRTRRVQTKVTNSAGRVRLLAVETAGIERDRGMGARQ